jgi:hypothetical protein
LVSHSALSCSCMSNDIQFLTQQSILLLGWVTKIRCILCLVSYEPLSLLEWC